MEDHAVQLTIPEKYCDILTLSQKGTRHGQSHLKSTRPLWARPGASEESGYGASAPALSPRGCAPYTIC